MFPVDIYECGDAERPVHSYSLRTETGAVDYRCVHGYRLLGPVTRHCLQDGQWSHSQPVCQGQLTISFSSS